MQDTAFGRSLDLLLSRRFGTFWFASLLSNIGTWAQQVAQPWLLLSLGASSFLIGLDAFAMSAPVWLLTLVGGVLADRADRRRVITVFQSIQMLCPTLLVVLLLTGTVRPWVVIGLSLVVGITDALSMPRRGAAPAAEDSDRRHLFAGVGDVAREPYLRGALLTLLATSALCGPLTTFCPVLVKDALHGDVGDFSVAVGAFGVGGLLGAIGLLFVDERRGLPPLLVLAGVSMSVCNTSANSLLLASTPPRLLGRTVSLFMLAMSGGISLGGLLTGVSVGYLGIRYALFVNGALTVVAIILVSREWLRSPLPTP